jgi:nucleotide-binding universal stress UspA family protein
MYTNILVPLDGSPFSELALPHAAALADKFDCKITLVTVFETPHIYQSFLDQNGGGLSVDYEFIEGGNVPAAILETIEENGADLIVMCTHGRTGLDRWRFGSVAQRVARHSPVPVVLIRPNAEDQK